MPPIITSVIKRWIPVMTAMALAACSGKGQKLSQYQVEGEQLYIRNCSNCHQKGGQGLGLVYPPLSPSDYMDTNMNAVICLMKKGVSGEIVVNGKMYNQPMPGTPELTDLEIAEITTYIYNAWGREHGLVDVKKVTGVLQSCSGNP